MPSKYSKYAKLPHPGIQTLQPYIPGKPIEALKRETGLSDIIKLASNENPLGCSPLVLKTLSALKPDDAANYPAYSLHPLNKALSQKWNIAENRITLSNGSDFIFTLLLMLFALHTDKHMLTHDKAFLSYQIQAQTLGIPFFNTPLLANWDVDIEVLLQACNAKTGIIFLANPNNPTGVLIPDHKIKHILTQIPKNCILVLDEAYYEYAYPDNHKPNQSLSFLDEFPNLVITRTFSKAYGLAGLRLGYALASVEISELLRRIQLPFNINQAAMHAGLTALNDSNFLNKTLALTLQGLDQLRQGLEELDLPVLPSRCNFLTFDCKRNSLPIYQSLLSCGIIVRPLTPYGLPNFLRVTVGKQKDNARFLKELGHYLVRR